MIELGLDERQVVVDGRAAGGGFIIGAEFDARGGRGFRDDEQRVFGPGQGEVGEEIVLGEISEFRLQPEVMVKPCQYTCSIPLVAVVVQVGS